MAQRRILWLIVLLILPALACNAFAGTNGEPTLAPPPTLVVDSQTPGEATATGSAVGEIAPTATLPGTAVTTEAAATPSATPNSPVVEVLVDLNVRNGPGVQYDRVGALTKRSLAALVGRDPASGWWKIQCPVNVNSPECWVAGGAQYTRPFNAEGVPVAVVPPTPTPVPAVLPDDTGLFVFVDNGRLLATQLNFNQTPLVPSEPVTLEESSDVQQALIAPNGRSVVYLVRVVGGNELRLVNIDGRNVRVLVQSETLPFVGNTTELSNLANPNDPNQTVQILTMQWLDENTLVFNTGVVNAAGFSPGSQSDLWTVTTDGTMQQRYSAGQGGPIFTISPRSQVLFSRTNAILRGNVDGSGLETVLTFDPVGISEAFYYPRPQWVDGGNRAYVAISDPLLSNTGEVPQPSATLYQIPGSGKAEKMGSLLSNVVADLPRWSADGNRMAFVALPEGSAQPELMIAAAVGQNGTPYVNEGHPHFWGWNGNNEQFLFGTGRYYAIGKVGESSTRFALADGEVVMQAEWVTREWFLTAVDSASSNALIYRLHNRDGGSDVVARANGRLPIYDLWLP